MTKRMLIDATHAEETRVVVLDGNRLEDYDVETSTKQQLKGNIYLAKVVRVEPSLQAAFVEYGGNRHGFLAFGEIHPDYYQIPVADRQRLLEMQEAEAREDEEAEDEAGETDAARQPQTVDTSGDAAAADAAVESAYAHQAELAADPDAIEPEGPRVVQAAAVATELRVAPDEARDEFPPENGEARPEPDADGAEPPLVQDSDAEPAEPPPEALGGADGAQDEVRRRPPPRFTRHYKIQEVIHRRQIMLIQVVKEERGTKGAALTTYISLAGRFSVLMPNSPRGGGVSRKITQASDRRRLKEVMQELDLPRGMGLIVRTAGANRPKPEIIRDCEYLLSQWDQIRETTMRSVAPALIYEEASLIKRAIRDVYSRDVEEVLVDGEEGWRAAREYMRMLMPAHARKVQLWREMQPLFAKQQVDVQLDAMLQPTVQLRSGGYLVINQTEALVAIDVNSGRSTRERGIEETAVRTNLEAAEEVARQLRLRDLAGLIVIDFIDMESRRNTAQVERRLKDALRNDRARIQVGSISHFGLLEMSRQRLRPSIAETSFVTCPHCGGVGHVRSTESAALHVLRGIEEEGAKRRSAEIAVHVAGGIALYILNHKRARLAEIENRFGLHVLFNADESLLPPQMRIEKLRAFLPGEWAPPASQPAIAGSPAEDELDAVEEEADVGMAAVPAAAEPDLEPDGVVSEHAQPVEAAEAMDKNGQRRRRRRRGKRDDKAATDTITAETAGEAGTETPIGTVPGAEAAEQPAAPSQEAMAFLEPGALSEGGIPTDAGEPEAAPADAVVAGQDASGPDAGQPAAEDDDPDRPRRRGRRGGRRRRKSDEDAAPAEAAGTATPPPPAEQDPAQAARSYRGPTPADPFAGQGFDVFEAMEQAEERRAADAALMATQPAEEAAPGEGQAGPLDGVEDSRETQPEYTPESHDKEPSPVATAGNGQAAPDPGPVPTGVHYDPSIAGPAAPPAEAAPVPPSAPPSAAVIVPILIGAIEADGQRKRGWWKR